MQDYSDRIADVRRAQLTACFKIIDWQRAGRGVERSCLGGASESWSLKSGRITLALVARTRTRHLHYLIPEQLGTFISTPQRRYGRDTASTAATIHLLHA